MKKPLLILIRDTNQYFVQGLEVVLETFFHLQQQPIQFLEENAVITHLDFAFLGNTFACPAWLHDLHQQGSYPRVFFIKDREKKKPRERSCGLGTINRYESVATLEQQLRRVLSRSDAAPSGCRCVNLLSPREINVMKHLVEGLNGKAIAQKLSISDKTANGHKQNVMRKLNFDSNHELYLWLLQSGIKTNRFLDKYGAPWDTVILGTASNDTLSE